MAVSSVTRSVAGTPQRPLERRPGRRRRIVAGLGLNTFLWALALLLVFPLFWIVSTSLLPREQIMSTAQRIITTDPTLENYRELFDATTFTTAVGNSLVVSVTVTVVGTYFAALAGYAFGKLHFHGRDLLFVLVLLTMMVPPMVTVPVNFVLMSKIGLLNTLWAVILPQLTPAVGIFWMRQYVRSAVPDELLEQARIDGAGEARIFHLVVLPLLKPALAGLAIYLFMQSWNQFLLPLTYLQDNNLQTFPVFINLLLTSYAESRDHLALAASVLSMLPVALMFVIGQRHFVAGATAGAVKE